MLKINCKRKRTVGKANKGINAEKIIKDLKKEEEGKKAKKRKKEKGKHHRITKAQCRGRGL